MNSHLGEKGWKRRKESQGTEVQSSQPRKEQAEAAVSYHGEILALESGNLALGLSSVIF